MSEAIPLDREDLGELRARAEAASAMLNSEVFNIAFSQLNQGIIHDLLHSPPEDIDLRERLYLQFHAGQRFVQQFATLINDLELRNQREEA